MIRLLQFLFPWWGAEPPAQAEPGIVTIGVTQYGCSTAITSHDCSVSVALIGGISVSVEGDN